MSEFKILFITIYSIEMNPGLEEMGAASLTAFMRDKGYEVMLLGCKENKIDYQRIVDFKPSLIGLPVYSSSKRAVYQFCERIRLSLPEVYLCVGGFLPTYYGEEMMAENSGLDFAVLGEGELTLWELVSRLERGEKPVGIPGLISRDSGEILIQGKRPELIPDLNVLPFPSRDPLWENKLKVAQISNSRGCYGHCSFCCCVNFWNDGQGRRWRGRDISRMVDEMESVHSKYGVNCFYLIDNSFEDPGANYQKVWDTATAILRRNLPVSYYLCFRAEFQRKMTPELLSLLKQSGLCNIYLGIESANDFDQKLYQKIASVEDNVKAVELYQNHAINITIGFINFNPYSTFPGLQQNIDFLEKYGFASHFPHLRRVLIFKGAELYEKTRNDGLLKDGDYDDGLKYHYLDSRIEQLVEFLTGYFRNFNRETANFTIAADFYANDFLAMLAHYQNQCRLKGQAELGRQMKEIETAVKEILGDLNRINSGWFRALLNLAETGWSEPAAVGMMDHFLERTYIRKTYHQLETMKVKVFQNMEDSQSR